MIATGARGIGSAPHRAVDSGKDDRGGWGAQVQPGAPLTGDQAVDEMLSGSMMVVTGYNERAVRRVATDGSG